ncbi:hypothetical protein F5B18DRAFT_630936 [Nemania serpens]|nr:hypothetical protein F5B18DRAFT_630936 [Nemania serpens]
MTTPLAALTTIFTPPCSITWLLTTTKVPSQYPPFPTQAPVKCDPPSWDEYVAQRGFNYYSPAICPSGFYVGPSCIVTMPRTGEGFPAIQDDETAAYCVPNGHVCTSDTTDFRGGVWGVSRTDTTIGAQVTVGPAIQIRWRDEDLESLETDPLPLTIPLYRSLAPPGSTPPESTPAYPEETTAYPLRPVQTALPNWWASTPPIPPAPSSSLPSGGSDLPPQTIPTQNTKTEALPSPGAPTSEIYTPPSSPAASTSGRPGAEPREKEGDNNSSGPSANLTVATAILISIIAIYSTYAILRRYRRYRAGDAMAVREFLPAALSLIPVRLSLSLSPPRFCLRLHRRGTAATTETEVEDEKPAYARKLPDAELGIDGPVPELASTYARGTRENPAELPSTERGSWKMRVSRMFLAARARGSSALGS